MTKQARKNTTNDPAFAAYMRDVAKYPVFTAAQERDLGKELVSLRTHYWREVLSYAPYTAAALQLLGQQLDAKKMSQLGQVDGGALATASRAVRDSNRKHYAETFERELAAFSERVASVDTECIAADRIAADLEALAAGQSDAVTMDVKPPRKGSAPFAEYLARVRAASAALRGIRNQFARANLRLVIRIASRFQRAALSLHDRVQEGNIGLMKAIDRFDPTRGFRFSTYASWWIKHSIRRAAVNRGRTIRLPAHLQATAGKLARARVELRQRLNRDATPMELAAEIEVPIEKVELTIEAMSQRAVSLDAPASSDDRSILETLASDEDRTLEELVADDHDATEVRGKLESLAPMERDILCQRFGLDGSTPRTLTEIGAQYSLSRERIRQLQQQALRRLRGRLDVSRPAANLSAMPTRRGRSRYGDHDKVSL